MPLDPIAKQALIACCSIAGGADWATHPDPSQRLPELGLRLGALAAAACAAWPDDAEEACELAARRAHAIALMDPATRAERSHLVDHAPWLETFAKRELAIALMAHCADPGQLSGFIDGLSGGPDAPGASAALANPAAIAWLAQAQEALREPERAEGFERKAAEGERQARRLGRELFATALDAAGVGDPARTNPLGDLAANIAASRAYRAPPPTPRGSTSSRPPYWPWPP